MTSLFEVVSRDNAMSTLIVCKTNHSMCVYCQPTMAMNSKRHLLIKSVIIARSDKAECSDLQASC